MLKNSFTYFFTTLLLFFIGIESNAATACFTPSAVKGCIPFTINLDPTCANYDPAIATPQYNYDHINNPGNANFTTSTTHTYTIPGTYRILQFIGNIATSTYQDILVVATPDPIFSIKSCIGKNVSVSITDPVYDKFEITWGDGSPIQTALPGSTTNHVYATDGPKSISVAGIFLPNATCATKTQSTYAITSIVKPDLTELLVTRQHVSNGEIRLTYNSIAGQNYRIERNMNGGGYGTMQTIRNAVGGVTSFSDPNLNTQSIVYQYRIVAFDDCVSEVISTPIYSIIIKATPTNNLNTVTWNIDPTVTNFELKKNDVQQAIASPTSTSYADNAIVCGLSYCYKTTASLSTLTLAGTAQKSISIDTCIKAISTNIPPAPLNLNSTINGSIATLSWTSAGSNINYNIYQSINGSAYLLLNKQATSNSYTTSLPNLSSSYCYQINYSDLCGNPSPKSATTCPVILEGTLSGTTISLNWNNYSGFSNTGVQSYIVQKIDQNGNVLSEINVGLSNTFSETVDLTEAYVNYRIKVIPSNAANSTSFSNNSLFKFDAEIFAPDVFTPNGDNTNDLFIIKGKFVSTFSITIFSRWGEVVYASTDMTTGWNGFNNNVYAPEGAYTYKIIATDINKKEFTKTGTVTLIR